MDVWHGDPVAPLQDCSCRRLAQYIHTYRNDICRSPLVGPRTDYSQEAAAELPLEMYAFDLNFSEVAKVQLRSCIFDLAEAY